MRRICLFTAVCLCMAALAGCRSGAAAAQTAVSETQAAETSAPAAAPASVAAAESSAAETAAAEAAGAETQGESARDAGNSQTAQKNGGIYVIFTSDIHCGVEQGFGFAGLQAIRDALEEQGYETILVDDGDALQGEPIGIFSKGEAVVQLMNEMKYDLAIPGNHDFDYGTERFLELAEMAEYPYISCNFMYKGEPVFEPYLIREAAGRKIGFVGVTTPETLVSSTPDFFQDETGAFVYDFLNDESGEALYKAVQDAVDAARNDGAELVYLIAHLGNQAECAPWTYADVIAHTTGIDAVLDGHSHDTEHVDMKNADGKAVARQAVGTKLNCIGYSRISAEGRIEETGLWSWPNKTSAPVLLNIQNGLRSSVDAKMLALDELMDRIIAHTNVELTIFDPEETDDSGNRIRMVRRAETNLGDLCADAFRHEGKADIAIMNSGAIRASIDKGDIRYKDILSVNPFGNTLCVVELTGQQLLDALEWGARSIPDENGAFLQVSGMTYEIDSRIPNPCIEGSNGMMLGIEGERRVRNVRIGGEPLEADRKYTVAGINYTLMAQGDGQTAFNDAVIRLENGKNDYQVLIDYITGTLGGEAGEVYSDPYGQDRIVIIE